MEGGEGAISYYLYRGITVLAGPWVRWMLYHRVRNGREEEGRIGERFGQASAMRPDGSLVWFHAASVGELLSLLTLLRALPPNLPPFSALVTTGTVSSAELAAKRLPPGCMHQYAPIDLPAAVRNFLDYWQPELAVRVESELWPLQIVELRRRAIPALLLNARLSPRSETRWHRLPGLARQLLKSFALVVAQSPEDAARLSALGRLEVRYEGNLKAAAEPLVVDTEALAEFDRSIAGRMPWVLASSHSKEEEIAAEVHRVLASQVPGLLTIIVPRHPSRGAKIAEHLRRRGMSVALRSARDGLSSEVGIYVADTMGEMGLWYRSALVAVIGGSFVPHGGHNPLEPAVLETPVLFGPYMKNFDWLARGLAAAGGARQTSVSHLAGDLRALMNDEVDRASVALAGAEFARAEGVAATEVVRTVVPWFQGL